MKLELYIYSVPLQIRVVLGLEKEKNIIAQGKKEKYAHIIINPKLKYTNIENIKSFAVYFS